MPPLAGRPPYATDEPDSAFEATPQQPQRRMRQPPPEDPNKRTSAYDVYDNYLSARPRPGATPADSSQRTSGIGNLLLNMGDDSDDDSDDEDERRPAKPPVPNKSTPAAPKAAPPPPPNKTAALAAAVGATPVSGPPRNISHQVSAPAQHPQQHPQAPRSPGPPSSPPRNIAAPRPGYALAAPIAALNGQVSTSPPLKSPASPQNPFMSPPQPSNLRGPPASFARPPPGSPAPHPLQPPITPITPAFIRPSSVSPSPTAPSFSSSTLVSPASNFEPSIKFSVDQRRPIIRGNTEETLLPSRGEKGDDFWRRFSIVAKEPSCRSESSWLKKTRSGTNRLSRYVWIVGLVCILAVIGGIGFGVWMSRTSPGHQQPKAIGGSADNMATGVTTTTTAARMTGTGGPTNSIKHVSPTNTVARRAPEPSALDMLVRKRR